jgi:hypothetical protein
MERKTDMVTVDELTNAIGKPMQSAEVQALISKLGPGTRKKGDLGIYYRHKTSGVILVENEARLAEIRLQPKGGGMTQYAGEVPLGVRLGQTRDEIRAALGEPTKAVATIADEYDQGLWTVRLNYEEGVVESVTLKAQ